MPLTEIEERFHGDPINGRDVFGLWRSMGRNI